jgi:hypothetical protein
MSTRTCEISNAQTKEHANFGLGVHSHDAEAEVQRGIQESLAGRHGQTDLS